MRAAWLALIAGVALGVVIVAAVTSPADDGLGPVTRALALERGPGIDARRAAAVAEAVGRCVARHGIDWQPTPDPPPAIPDAELAPIPWAERWGFGITTVAGGLARSSEAVAAAATGPSGPMVAACHEEAATTVHGLRERLLAPLRPALAALGARIDADPATAAADAAWAACAKDGLGAVSRPLPVPDAPGQLDALRAWFQAAAGPSADPAVIESERRAAAAIARCDLALVEARRRAAAPHERAFVEAYAGELARIGAAIRSVEAAYPTSVP